MGRETDNQKNGIRDKNNLPLFVLQYVVGVLLVKIKYQITQHLCSVKGSSLSVAKQKLCYNPTLSEL